MHRNRCSYRWRKILFTEPSASSVTLTPEKCKLRLTKILPWPGDIDEPPSIVVSILIRRDVTAFVMLNQRNLFVACDRKVHTVNSFLAQNFDNLACNEIISLTTRAWSLYSHCLKHVAINILFEFLQYLSPYLIGHCFSSYCSHVDLCGGRYSNACVLPILFFFILGRVHTDS